VFHRIWWFEKQNKTSGGRYNILQNSEYKYKISLFLGVVLIPATQEVKIQEDCSSRLARMKSYQDSISTNKPGMVA
jgi:hypothetical protein